VSWQIKAPPGTLLYVFTIYHAGFTADAQGCIVEDADSLRGSSFGMLALAAVTDEASRIPLPAAAVLRKSRLFMLMATPPYLLYRHPSCQDR